MQVQRPSIVNDKQEYEVLGTDISCNLGSTNVVNLMNSPDFGKSVETMVRALTYVTDVSSIETVPTVKNGNDKAHTIGLGAMNLHGMFALNQMEYGSPESIEFTDVYFNLLNYYSLVASNKIAKERNISFDGFENSKYYSGTYFDDFAFDIEFKHEKNKELFKNIQLPTKEDWLKLKRKVRKHGLYHQNRLAIAP